VVSESTIQEELDGINQEFEAAIHKNLKDDSDRYKFIGSLYSYMNEEKQGEERKELIAQTLISEANNFSKTL